MSWRACRGTCCVLAEPRSREPYASRLELNNTKIGRRVTVSHESPDISNLSTYLLSTSQRLFRLCVGVDLKSKKVKYDKVENKLG